MIVIFVPLVFDPGGQRHHLQIWGPVRSIKQGMMQHLDMVNMGPLPTNSNFGTYILNVLSYNSSLIRILYLVALFFSFKYEYFRYWNQSQY